MKTIIPNVKVGEIKTKPYQLKNILLKLDQS